MAKKSVDEQIKKGLLDLAVGSVSDAMLLLFLDDEEIIRRLPRLKLSNISEIKRPKGGGMEIKFFDRIKAFEKLQELSGIHGNQGLSFYQALEKGAQDLKEADKNDLL